MADGEERGKQYCTARRDAALLSEKFAFAGVFLCQGCDFVGFLYGFFGEEIKNPIKQGV
ncbi:hypothetical protein [Trichloromonas acetexigens]|uniref:hypothetical protein n=1 Tax=Trichloromonas acetexigens TaxID=38815 RepID=UPI00147912ED|nr:hypothetical protein [Desulfuromonas acetexigens]